MLFSQPELFFQARYVKRCGAVGDNDD